MHELAFLDEVFGGGVVVVAPEGFGDVADVVDAHEADAAEESEHDEELVEGGGLQEGEACDVCVRVLVVWFRLVQVARAFGDEGGVFGGFCVSMIST